jgi:hypothetical protein
MVAGGKLAAFRLDEHHRSCRMLGIDTWDMPVLDSDQIPL